MYFHDPNNEDWTLGSYLRLHNISTVEDFWACHNAIKEKLKNGMFFMMREHVFPCWDDEYNINGGCISIKVLKESVVEFWESLCIRVLGENLLDDSHEAEWDKINGISTSPKRYFCIIKIWLKDNTLNDKKFFKLLNKYYGDVIYRDNMDNIQRNNEVA